MERTARPWKLWAPAALVFAYMAAVFAAVHVQSPGLTERDGYFHARYAQLMPKRLLSRRFEWTQASTWKEDFCDKEFLYHALMAPFARGEDPVQGALVFSTALSAGVFAAFYLFLRAHRVRGALLFTLALAAMGGPFLLRVSFVRSHVLSILFVIAGFHLLHRGRWKALGVLGFFYSWSYSFPLLLPALALPYVLGRWWAEGGETDLKPFLACLAGVLLGLFIHPYAPNSLETLWTYLDVLGIAASRRSLAAVEVGREFAPYSTRSFLQAYPLMTASILGLGLAGWRTRKELAPESMGLLCAAAAAFLATMVYARAAEYAAPLTAAAAAFALRDFLDEAALAKARSWARGRVLQLWAAGAGLAVILFGLHLVSLSYVFAMGARSEPPRFKGAAEWMAGHLEPGETVVQLWWDDFPDLFYHAYRQRFLVALDPTYMLRYDRDKAMMLERMRTGRIPIDAAALAEAFDARTMVLRTPTTRFYPQLISGFWQPVYHDNQAAVFALTGPFGPPANVQGLPRIPALGR